MSEKPPPPEAIRRRIEIEGTVQGIGFRPFVYRTARDLGLRGWVRNESGRVVIEVEGEGGRVESFLRRLHDGAPAWAQYEQVRVTNVVPRADLAESEFAISASAASGRIRPGIPPDLAVCPKCLAEMRDPADRRYRYPFINCTECGPRWSIIEGVPYDRPLTSMKSFAMCAACRTEYENPVDRRFHAQPIACPSCGPQIALLEPVPEGNGLRFALEQPAAVGDDALQRAASAVLAGQVLALKGLGGYQLICDATNQRAVMTLRRRKRRPDKPLAVMLTEAMLASYCRMDGLAEDEALRSAASPIVLLPRVRETEIAGQPAPISEAVAPGNPYLGVMLPYTPLHHLLAEAVDRPIVCTSGNLSEEPMATEDRDAVRRLGPIADVFLVHNRPIVRPVDDSVVLPGEGGCEPRVIRRARGFAPAPLRSRARLPVILAVGGHLKNAVALSVDDRIVLGSHVGDLDNRLAIDVHRRAVDDLLRFFQRRPDYVACDLHPDYASTRVAEELARAYDAPLVRVQHHEAHLAAVLAEVEHQQAMGRAEEVTMPAAVLGAMWDGTGYGRDGTVWGGEFIVYDGNGFRRAAHLRKFRLPGGDAVVRDPRRSALGVLYEFFGEAAFDLPGAGFSSQEQKTLRQMLARGFNAPQTSSMGRLFDAVAAICGLVDGVSFEGQAAMALEFAAEEYLESSADGKAGLSLESIALVGSEPIVLDWEPTIRSLLEYRNRGEPVGRLAAAFHAALIDAAAAVAERLAIDTLAAGGGCFHNRLLTRRLLELAGRRVARVWVPSLVPCGDGGIALGQLWYAAHYATQRSEQADHAVD